VGIQLCYRKSNSPIYGEYILCTSYADAKIKFAERIKEEKVAFEKKHLAEVDTAIQEYETFSK
jgi:hypothetical protein